MTEKEAFCEHIRQCENAMYALAYSIVRNDHDAADVISEAIYRGYRAYPTLKNKKAFRTWMLRIVHNTAIEMIRNQGKMTLMETIPETAYTEEDGTLTTKLALWDVVNTLQQPYRTVIVLFYYEDLSISKIAQITGSSAAAVKQQLSRGRAMLREILKEDFHA